MNPLLSCFVCHTHHTISVTCKVLHSRESLGHGKTLPGIDELMRMWIPDARKGLAAAYTSCWWGVGRMMLVTHQLVNISSSE